MLQIDIEHFRARVLMDCLLQATSEYWLRRAEDFEAALPRPGDYPGQATPEERTQRMARNAQTAINCRRHAALLAEQTEIAAEVHAALAEVS